MLISTQSWRSDSEDSLTVDAEKAMTLHIVIGVVIAVIVLAGAFYIGRKKI